MNQRAEGNVPAGMSSPHAPQQSPVSLAKTPPRTTAQDGEGCLVVALRLPVRIITLVLVVPVRLLWDALCACGRALDRVLWRPFARAAEWLWKRLLAPVLYAVLAWPFIALWRYVLAPVGRALAWLASVAGRGLAAVGGGFAAAGRGIAAGVRGLGAGLAWLGRVLFVVPAVAVYRHVLTPVGHVLRAAVRGFGAGMGWLGRYLLVVPAVSVWAGLVWTGRYLLVIPAVAVYRHVLTPVGHVLRAAVLGFGTAMAWLGRYLLVVPAVAVWTALVRLVRVLLVVPAVAVHRHVLAPLGRGIALVVRETATALGHAWRVAGYISRAVFGFLGRVLRLLLVSPFVWVWQYALAPAGRGVRDHLWRPVARGVREAARGVRQALRAARASVRETRAEIRKALFGAPRKEERGPQP
ncbi:hypothetical protein [Streptomyces sp. ODS28]|uniref:hypothetical protein n=1 Tax=Streptomyces sp. ODS28 TaxID=3136688 RepID=UPI0031EEB99E